jgi:hypothetical protein
MSISSLSRRTTRLRVLRARLCDDRGSLSMAVVIWTPIVMVLCAFVVNMGFLISDREKANDLAEQAARRVAEQVDEAVLKLHGGVLRVDVDPQTNDCLTIAQQYFTDNGIPGITLTSCTVTNNPDPQGVAANPAAPAVVTVKLRMTHNTLFTGFLPGGPANVVATGTATPIPV